jgi:3-isopropylmalate/(R)-2-methylmalate dehydratase small subunit
MTPFTVHEGQAAALLRDNIDTDAIIPSREMKSPGRTGLAAGLFANWRYRDPASREPDPDFVLNRQPGASILLAGANFGCGSSREHAVWALAEWGIRAIVAPSFGAIFFDNCVRNGLLPVVLPREAVAQLAGQGGLLRVDLLACTVQGHPFSLPDDAREQLLSGLDALDRTLKLMPIIEAFEQADRLRRPWAYWLRSDCPSG